MIGVLIGFAFIAVLVVLAPARLATSSIESDLFEFHEANGTLWQGSAKVYYLHKELGIFQWEINTLQLLAGEIDVAFRLDGSDLSLEGTHNTDGNRSRSTLGGTIGSRFANSHLVNYDISLSGDLSIFDVKLIMSEPHTVEDFSGSVAWDGGPVHFNFAQSVYSSELEAIDGHFGQQEQDLLLTIFQRSDNSRLLTIRLEPNSGWLHIRATPAFLEFTHIPPSFSLRDSDFAFEVSERIY